jgi:hypothetical protein
MAMWLCEILRDRRPRWQNEPFDAKAESAVHRILFMLSGLNRTGKFLHLAL